MTPAESIRCLHAPECPERFESLDTLNEHLDGTFHECCHGPLRPARSQPAPVESGPALQCGEPPLSENDNPTPPASENTASATGSSS